MLGNIVVDRPLGVGSHQVLKRQVRPTAFGHGAALSAKALNAVDKGETRCSATTN